MGKNVVVTLVFGDQDFPAGTAVDHVDVKIQSADGSIGVPLQSLPVGMLTASFDNVPPGDWIASAQAGDPAGQPVGVSVSSPFTVPADAPATVTLSVPISVTVALS